MLVLSRKQDQTIVINGDITVKVLGVQGSRVRLGIEAPDHLLVLRGELTEWHSSEHEQSDAMGASLVTFA